MKERKEHTAAGKIGIAALALDRKLDAVHAYAYRVIFDQQPDGVSSAIPSDDEAIRQIRRAARLLSFANGHVPITNLDAWNVVSLTKLSTHVSDWVGVKCRATDERVVVLRSENPCEREAIQRLLNQSLMQGAMALARSSGNSMEADLGAGGHVELRDLNPSERVPIRNTYLEAFKTVVLIPEVLPDGTALITFNVRHRLLPTPNITMDWVIRRKPEWLESNGIRRVRHRYELPGRGYLTAEWLGVADGLTPMSTFQTAEGETTYFDYHYKAGNIPKGEEALAQKTWVVTVRYDKKRNPVHHLASLLQPVFDFETLQQIDSPLLNRIARHLKWSVDDRLRAAYKMVRGIQIPHWNAALRSIEDLEKRTRSLKPTVRLKFAQRKCADTEKAVLQLGAYRGMSRKRIVPMTVGAEPAESASAQQHFHKVKEICDRWSGGTSPSWTKPMNFEDAEALEARLIEKNLPDTVLLIALGKQVDKRRIRDIAFGCGMATQFMRLDHSAKTYQDPYYNNLAAGLFSKAGGMICAIDEMPGDTELFIGLDLGGTGQRLPGIAFLFTREGAQLGWQLAEAQRGERVSDEVLKELLERSLKAFKQAHLGRTPTRIALHRDGRFFESLSVIQEFEKTHGVGIDVLEVVKSGAPPLYRRTIGPNKKKNFRNPEVGDAFVLTGLDELIVSTYSGDELGSKWGQSVTVHPLRLRKRYGETDLETLAQQVILLSRIHGASLYRHPRLPVTIHHADRFATLRQECNLDDLSKMDRLCPVYL
jgi:hypothetical protein